MRMERFPGEEAARQSGETTGSGAGCLDWTRGSPPTGYKALGKLLNLSGLSLLP